jgi:phosphonoacetaldehyde hydrolase
MRKFSTSIYAGHKAKTACGIKRQYNGKATAIILDWSGTTLDKGVLAPAVVFKQIFDEVGVNVTMKHCREPMGKRKDIHVNRMLEIPEVRELWKKVRGAYPTEKDGESLFKRFIPLQLACLKQYSTIIAGADVVTQNLHKAGIKIGATTGFLRDMSKIIWDEGKKQGLHIDCVVSGDDVTTGVRPFPHMLYKNLDLLGIENINSVIKVDDTVAGVGEGLNGGCWTVAVTDWSNYTDYDSLEQMENASEEDKQSRIKKSFDVLKNSGAHFIINDINQLPEVVDTVNGLLSRQLTPSTVGETLYFSKGLAKYMDRAKSV